MITKTESDHDVTYKNKHGYIVLQPRKIGYDIKLPHIHLGFNNQTWVVHQIQDRLVNLPLFFLFEQTLVQIKSFLFEDQHGVGFALDFQLFVYIDKQQVVFEAYTECPCSLIHRDIKEDFLKIEQKSYAYRFRGREYRSYPFERYLKVIF